MIGPSPGLVMAQERWMTEDAAVWRRVATQDAGGGSTVQWIDQQRTVRVQLAPPTAKELEVAAQEGVEVTHAAVMPLGSDVSRGDRLVVGARAYELTSDPLLSTHSTASRALARQSPTDEPLT